MLDLSKLEEINMNNDTIKMMKDLNMNNDEIKNELTNLLEYNTNLIECLVYDLNKPLFQSILLRLKLQEKLKLDNDKLINSFNFKLHPLISYLLNNSDSSIRKKKAVPSEKVVVNEINVQETNEQEIKEETKDEETNEQETNEEETNDEEENRILEYIEESIEEENNTFLLLEEVYDDFANDWLDSKEYDNINEDNFVKFFTKKYGKISTKKGKKGWKNIKIID